MVLNVNRRDFLVGSITTTLVNTTPTISLAAGSPYSTESEKVAFQDSCLRRIEGLENYIQRETPDFSSQMEELEANYGFPKELILAIIGVEAGTPWLGASRSTSYFKDTVGTGWRDGKLRAAAGLPQMFDAAYEEAIASTKGDSSLIRNSSISRTRMILEEILPNEVPTVPYQRELIAGYLTRLRVLIKPTGCEEDNIIVLAQAYNSGPKGIINNGGREYTQNLAQDLVENPLSVTYPNNGVDGRYAQKIYDLMNRI